MIVLKQTEIFITKIKIRLSNDIKFRQYKIKFLDKLVHKEFIINLNDVQYED